MKVLKWLGSTIVILLAVIYIAAFTSLGNGIVAPIIEKKINEATQLNTKLETFVLRINNLDIVLALDPENQVEVKGNFSLFSQTLDISYNVALSKLSNLEKLAQIKLNGGFFTQGRVFGNLDFITVDGKSDVATSNTTYHVELEEFNPTSIIAKVQELDLDSLLFMIGQKKYASAKIDLDLNFKNIKPHQLDGDIKLITTKGLINTSVMKKDFGVTIPKTSFGMNVDAQLRGDEIIYNYLLDSNLAKIVSKGTVLPEPLQLDTIYSVNVQELGVFKPITNAELRGALNVNGTVKGSADKLVLQGKSDIASSNTTFEAILKQFQPSSVEASIKHLKLQKLLYMVYQPHYADATFNLDAKLTSLDPKNLQGKVSTAIKDGIVDSKYITKAYEFESPMPKTTFNGTTNTVLKGTLVDTQVDMNSNLADFNIKSAKFDLHDASIKSDYRAKLHNLDKLYFVTAQHMKGSITAEGDLSVGKDLDFTMQSQVAGGKLNAKLHNDDFSAKLSNMQTLELLHILIYPEVFKSRIDGDVKYNLAQASGTFNGKLKEGTFTQNQVLDLTKEYTKINLYREKFLGDVNAKIEQEKITASLDLKSKNSSISTKDTKLNSETKKIDSKIKIVADNNAPIFVKLKGDVTSPKVSVDASKLVKKVVEKEVKKLIEDKETQKKVKDEAKKLFKKFF